MSNYGFVLDPNPEDYFKLALNLSPADPQYSQKKDIVSEMGISLVHLLFNDDLLPSELLKALRFLSCNSLELRSSHQPEFGQTLVSARNELHSLKSFQKLLSLKLDALVSTIPDFSGRELTSEQNQWISTGLLYRNGTLTFLFDHTSQSTFKDK